MGALRLAEPPGGSFNLVCSVSAYLPLNLEPEMDRQIERVLILADEPILKRPFAVALVEDALPEACKVDAVLCGKVRKYLERYQRDYAVTHASVAAAVSHGGNTAIPDEYGLMTRDDWQLSGQAYVQPNDYFLANVGVVAYAGRTAPTGSMLSFGTNWAQVDIGYRDHWWSPLTDSSMLQSTEAPTMPSVTLSNYEPLTRLGIQYEVFLAKMSDQPIVYNGLLGRGNPRLFGTQFSIEPFPGWSVGINRTLQYGGADGLPSSAHFLLSDYFHPSGTVQDQGNQEASYISRFIFPGKTPFAVYFQYAGENTEDGGSYLLGNSSLSAGIDFPKIARYFDLTYEVSEWQNTWYTHFIYLGGMTNDGFVTGNWGADQRVFNDGIGARSQMLRLGWLPDFGGYLEERVRMLANQSYYAFGDARGYDPGGVPHPYHHYLDFTLRYSRPVGDLTVGGELIVGRDVLGQSFSRLSGFVRYGGDSMTRDDGTSDGSSDDDTDGSELPDVRGTELFVDAGMNVNKVRVDLEPGVPITTTQLGFGPHLGLGARREVAKQNDLGVRAEFDEVAGHSLIGVRAIDYRYRFSNPLALTAFVGVVRYDLATPAFSLYGGFGAQWRNVLPHWDLNLDLRYAQNVARDHLLATDPVGSRPDSFYKIQSATFYVSRKF